MSISGEFKGKLIEIGDTTQVSEKFKKREFVVEVENERNTDWNDFVKIQVVQDRCMLLDNFTTGDEVLVNYNLRGRKYERDGEKRYFNSVECWRIERNVAPAPQENSGKAEGSDFGNADLTKSDDEDLPF